MKIFFLWLIGVIVLAIAAGALYFYFEQPAAQAPLPDISFASSSQQSSASTSAPPDGFKEYRNTDYRFSIFYPSDLPPQESHDEGYAMTVAFQAEAGQQGFQIYVAPINGTTITQDRFLLDEPSGVRKNAKNVTIDGIPAVSFQGYDAQIGDTAEVWFIKNGFLYEVSTYQQLNSWLSNIMTSWKFI